MQLLPLCKTALEMSQAAADPFCEGEEKVTIWGFQIYWSCGKKCWEDSREESPVFSDERAACVCLSVEVTLFAGRKLCYILSVSFWFRSCFSFSNRLPCFFNCLCSVGFNPKKSLHMGPFSGSYISNEVQKIFWKPEAFWRMEVNSRCKCLGGMCRPV